MNYKKLKLTGFMMIVLVFLTTSPVLAESGKFSVGAMGGGAFSITKEAIEGFSETEFKNSEVYGGSIMYRFPSGFALELCVERLSMDLEESGENFGALNMLPVMFLFKYQGIPEKETGFTGHADIGGGINFTSFDKGSFITDLEKTYGVQYTIDTDKSFVFELGVGPDYFFTKNLSLFLDGRLLLTNVGTSWKVSGPGGALVIEDIDNFFATNFQTLLGVRYWF